MIIFRYLIGFIVIGALWKMGSLAWGRRLLPDPWATTIAFFEGLTTPTLWQHIGISAVRLVGGIALALITAIPFGLLMGHCVRVDRWISPLLFITFPIPKIVLLPVLFTLVGIGEASRILLIALTVGYQLLVILRAEAQNMEPTYEKVFWSMGGTRWQAIRHIYWPAMMPSLMTGLKIATGTAMAVLFLAESFATTSGLGYLIMDSWGMGQIKEMFVAIFTMSLLGLTVYSILGVLERILLPWTHREKRMDA